MQTSDEAFRNFLRKQGVEVPGEKRVNILISDKLWALIKENHGNVSVYCQEAIYNQTVTDRLFKRETDKLPYIKHPVTGLYLRDGNVAQIPEGESAWPEKID